MARREVLELTCDRCGRVETQSTSEASKPEGVKNEVTVTFHGETITYEDLCRRCRDAVKGYYNKISKKAEEKKTEDTQDNVTNLDPAENAPQKRRFLGGK